MDVLNLHLFHLFSQSKLAANSLSKQVLEQILRNKKILLADDEAVNRIVLKKNLEGYGLIVEQASDGKELYKKYTDSIKEWQRQCKLQNLEKGDLSNISSSLKKRVTFFLGKILLERF